jgi:hypothetical protein
MDGLAAWKSPLPGKPEPGRSFFPTPTFYLAGGLIRHMFIKSILRKISIDTQNPGDRGSKSKNQNP